VVKIGRLRWAGHVGLMGIKRCLESFVVEIRREQSEQDREADGRIILLLMWAWT